MADTPPTPTAPPANWPPSCSEWAWSQDLSPIGSAGHYQGYLLVELALPWPADISEVPELAEVAGVAAAAGLRLQAVTAARPGASAPPAGRRLICYRTARPGWAGPLSRKEVRVGPDQLLAQAAADVVGAEPGADGADDGAGWPTPRPGAAEVTDVLVCTHGRRDLCCGAKGMELVRALSETEWLGPPDGGARPEVRLWRTSHTGGHRFAPTALVLPSATLWAWADAPLMGQVVGARGPIADVVGRYRGCATLGPPAHQALERSVLAEVGWPLLRSWRRASSSAPGTVVLETGEHGCWEAAVRAGRRVPQPECRTPPELATKYGVEWVVADLRQVPTA